MLIPLLTLTALTAGCGGLLAVCAALVQRARHTNGWQAVSDPYETADDDLDGLADCTGDPDPDEMARQLREAMHSTPILALPDTPYRRPLPRRLRRIPIQFPPHVDPPLTPDQFAEVATRWPQLVSAFFRNSHQPQDPFTSTEETP